MKILDYAGLAAQIAKEKERFAQIEQRLEQLAADIADGSITTAKLADGAVVNPKLADNAVTEAKIYNDAVSADKIRAGAVTTYKLADLAVTVSKIADNAIVPPKIADGAILTNKLANNAVAPGKFLPGAALTTANPISNTNPPLLAAGQMQLHTVYNGSGPAAYGNLLNIGGSGGGQLFLGWSGAQSAPGDSNAGALYYRSRRDNIDGFTEWRQVQFVGGGEISPHTAWKQMDIPEFAAHAMQEGSFSLNIAEYTANGVVLHAGTWSNVKKEGSDGSWFMPVSYYDYAKYAPADPLGTNKIGIKLTGGAKIRIRALNNSGTTARTLVMFRASTGAVLGSASFSANVDKVVEFDYTYPGYNETVWLCTSGGTMGVKAIEVN